MKFVVKINKFTFWGVIRLEATSLEELSALISSRRITILNKQWLLQSCLFFSEKPLSEGCVSDPSAVSNQSLA